MTTKQKNLITSAYDRLRKKVDQRPSILFSTNSDEKKQDFKNAIEQSHGAFKDDYPKDKTSVQIVNEMRKQWRTT